MLQKKKICLDEKAMLEEMRAGDPAAFWQKYKKRTPKSVRFKFILGSRGFLGHTE